MKRFWTALLCGIGMLCLILDTKTAIAGAYDGIVMCIRSVIPSLFPFFVLSGMLTGTLTGIKGKFLAPLSKFCGMPSGSESILLTGLLGGYPIGAKAVAEAYRNGQIDKQDARRMLGFCSNAGPSFLFGILGAKFTNLTTVWLLWAIQILSALLTGALLPYKSANSSRLLNKKDIDLPTVMGSSIGGMASVCGWVILFRCFIAFLQRWVFWLLPTAWEVTVIGVLELANGCLSIELVGDETLRFILCSSILSFGGLCVAMQTASVTGELGMGSYFVGKLLQCAISTILAIAVQGLFLHPFGWAYFLVAALGSVLIWIILRKIQKSSSNRQPIGV